MKEFKASLLREKFTLVPDDKDDSPIIAMSNRIAIPLASPDGIDNEEFVVRTQNMHSCARMAATIVKEFTERGTIIHRAHPVPWSVMWNDVIKGYEKNWNEDIWCAIYFKGRVIFQSGEHHPFLDIIEQCDANNMNNYGKSIKLAEDIFAQAGKTVSITHDSNIALVLHTTPEMGKSGIIVRAATGTTTFNYSAKPRSDNDMKINAFTSLTVAASFLEAIQLAFTVGLLRRKKEFKMIERFSEEDKKFDRSKTRLGNLNRAISKYEEKFDVNYRPDRPNFNNMVEKAQEAATKILMPEIKKRIEDGELDSRDWIV